MEDYLTECLADLFNRFDGCAQKQFIRRLFVPAGEQSKWDRFSSGFDALRMETQHAILKGRIDLVVFAGSDPVVVIENKIDAPISENFDGDDQLEIYGRWITATNRSAFHGVVCLLTHLTEPSEGFISGAKRCGGATPHVVKWSSLAGALMDVKEFVGPQQVDVITLASEFLRFLEEMNMSHDFAGRDEFAAAMLYLRAGSRMDYTFKSIYDHVRSRRGCFAAGSSIREMSLHFDTKYSLIWGWKYLAHLKFTQQLFFGYGIALEPALTFQGSSAPTREAVFLLVGAEGARSMQSLRAAKDLPKKPWTYADLGDWSAIVCFKSLHSFMADPEKFAPQMTEWIDEWAAYVDTFVSSDLK
jgi:hypothetical protein